MSADRTVAASDRVMQTARVVTERDSARIQRRVFVVPPRPGLLHFHRYRWSADQPFGNGSLYACRCGAVRCGF